MTQLYPPFFSQTCHTSEDNRSQRKGSPSMNIAIFGASGATGTLLTQRCLTAGYSVRALLRSPEKFPLRDQVHIIQGSPFDLRSVGQTIEDADAVLSALGAKSLKKEDVLERAVPQIFAAIEEHV